MTGTHPCWTDDVELAKMLAIKADLRLRAMDEAPTRGGPIAMANLLCHIFPSGGDTLDPDGEATFEEILQAILLLFVPSALDYSRSDIAGAFSDQVADLVFAMKPNSRLMQEANWEYVEHQHFVSSRPVVQTIRTLAIYVSCNDIIPVFGVNFARRWVKRMSPLLRAMEDASAAVHLVTHAHLLQLEAALDELEG